MNRIVIVCLALGGCGSAAELRPRAGRTLPPAPYGATATPTSKQLMTPTPQQRPQTVDEPLTKSEQRRSDEFDLPPGSPERGADASDPPK